MRTLSLMTLLPISIAIAPVGCGGSASNDLPDAAASTTGGHSNTGGTGGVSGSSGSSCDVIGATAAQTGLCTEAIDCAKQECKPAFATCLGDGYANEVFVGRDCSAFANCVKACNCQGDCVQQCTLSMPCADCLTEFLLPAVAQSSCAPIAYLCYTDPA